MRYTRLIGMRLAILLLFGGISTVSHAKIVFCSKRNGDTDYHIYVMEDNGSNVRRITSPDFYDRHPRWFPDGKRILFSRDLTRGSGQRDNEFYIIDADGRNERGFMENHPTDFHPVPSPDGKQIAFTSGRVDEWGDIYTYHLESGQLKQLTHNLNTDGASNRMDWSPDGSKIAYEHDTAAEGSNVWIMNADGSRKRRLSPPANKLLNRGAPRWSPSGKYIMYDESEGILNNGILTKLKESLVVQIVNTGAREVHKFSVKDLVLTGSWMGNDQTVLLSIKKGGTLTANYEIYRYDLVSRRLTNLTNQPGGDYYPHWIRGDLAVFPAGKLTTLWGQLKQTD